MYMNSYFVKKIFSYAGEIRFNGTFSTIRLYYALKLIDWDLTAQ